MQPPKDASAPNLLQKRPTTPGKSSQLKENTPPIPEIATSKKEDKKDKEHRRSSLAFLRRSKSGDTVRQRPAVPSIPQEAPKLPDLGLVNGSPPRQGRESVDVATGGLGIPGMSPGRKSIDSGVSSGYAPGKSSGKDSITLDEQQPLNAAVSMANRGRYSVASAGSTVNSPRRVRRRKDPTPFNILVIGARNSGKTSFIQFLRQSLAIKSAKNDPPMEATPEDAPVAPSKSTFVKTYLETEIDGERIGLTLWDSQGFEKNIVDLQLRETIAFIESKFEESFTEETKVVRAPGVRDTHIHCAFHLIDPARLESSIVRATSSLSSANGNILSGGLDEDLDLQVLRSLKGKTTVVPVISKADTITTAHMNVLKHLVRQSLRSQGLDPLEALEIDLDAYGITPSVVPPNMHSGSTNNNKPASTNGNADDQEGEAGEDNEDGKHHHHRRSSRASVETASTILDNEMSNIEFLPLSIISPDSYEPGAIGRKFPWGFADPYNAEHCDFLRLKEAVFSEWRGELRESSREIWYENWRTSRLSGPGGNGAARKNGARRR